MKRAFVAAALAAFVFASCSDNQHGATTKTQEHAHHDGMVHGDSSPAAGSVVVEAPDYSSVQGPVVDQVASVLEGYLRLKDRLVASDAQQVQNMAKALLASVEKVDVSGLDGEQKAFAEERLGEVKQSASKIADTTDLAAQRNQLELLSEATFALTKAFGASTATLFYQHCPMANNNQGAYWLSSDGEISNPYFGDSMLTCGRIKEVFN